MAKQYSLDGTAYGVNFNLKKTETDVPPMVKLDQLC